MHCSGSVFKTSNLLSTFLPRVTASPGSVRPPGKFRGDKPCLSIHYTATQLQLRNNHLPQQNPNSYSAVVSRPKGRSPDRPDTSEQNFTSITHFCCRSLLRGDNEAGVSKQRGATSFTSVRTGRHGADRRENARGQSPASRHVTGTGVCTCHVTHKGSESAATDAGSLHISEPVSENVLQHPANCIISRLFTLTTY